MFIVSLTYKCPIEEIDKHLNAHVNFLQEQYEKNNFLASGRKIPRTGGIILSGLKNLDDLKLILAQDPFYKADVADYDITEFIPSMAAKEFENLIGL